MEKDTNDITERTESAGIDINVSEDDREGGPMARVPGDEAMNIILEKVHVVLAMHVSPSVLDEMIIEQRLDPISRSVIAQFEMWLWSNKIHTETTKRDLPDGWFQAFKHSNFPRWLKNRFPVRYTQVFSESKTFHICPHLNYKTRDEEKYHLQFLTPSGDLTRHGA